MTRYWRVDAVKTIKGEWWVEADTEEEARLAFEANVDYEEPENTNEEAHLVLSVVETTQYGKPVGTSSDSGAS